MPVKKLPDDTSGVLSADALRAHFAERTRVMAPVDLRELRARVRDLLYALGEFKNEALWRASSYYTIPPLVYQRKRCDDRFNALRFECSDVLWYVVLVCCASAQFESDGARAKWANCFSKWMSIYGVAEAPALAEFSECFVADGGADTADVIDYIERQVEYYCRS